MLNNIKIRDVQISHGSLVLDNEFFINHFKKQGKDVGHFLNDVLKKDKRYIMNPNKENTLELAINASKKILDNNGLSGNDIDMICFSSQLPEYTAPPSSVLVHKSIGGKNECFCYDINVNCAGMVFAVEQAYRYMSTNENINRVLIIGSDCLNLGAEPTNELLYGHYGDCACAVILEKEMGVNTGLMDSRMHTYSYQAEEILFPKCGYSKIHSAQKDQLYYKWEHSGLPWIDDVVKDIKELVSKNGLSIDDISLFCFSQLSYKTIKQICKDLNVSEDKFPYIGDKYGYTGTSSPFIAYYESIKDKEKACKDEYMIFWGLGAGTQSITMLIKN